MKTDRKKLYKKIENAIAKGVANGEEVGVTAKSIMDTVWPIIDFLQVHGKPRKLSQVFAKRHIIYTYKGEVYEAEKYWSIEHAEKVLSRLGATYWEISI